jgi:hypothetical protein
MMNSPFETAPGGASYHRGLHPSHRAWGLGALLLALALSAGCAQTVSPCEAEEIRACEATRYTVDFFNRLHGAPLYSVDDCVQLISYRCSMP